MSGSTPDYPLRARARPHRGGRRPGAGAPKGNLNALKHGRLLASERRMAERHAATHLRVAVLAHHRRAAADAVEHGHPLPRLPRREPHRPEQSSQQSTRHHPTRIRPFAPRAHSRFTHVIDRTCANNQPPARPPLPASPASRARWAPTCSGRGLPDAAGFPSSRYAMTSGASPAAA